VRASPKEMMGKLPCVREALPYVPTEAISVKGAEACSDLQASASGAAVLPGPKRDAQRKTTPCIIYSSSLTCQHRLLITATLLLPPVLLE